MSRFRGQVAMVDGGFDPLHAGHMEYFRAAAALGAPVLCNISSDNWIKRKHPVLLPQGERAEVIDAIRFVDYTHISAVSTEEVLRELRPRYYVKGSDWRDRLPDAEVATCKAHGVEIVLVETVSNSSTDLLSDWERRAELGELA